MARITATPGRFCEAMVTMNKGKARLMKAGKVNTGMVNTGCASSSRTADHCICPPTAAQATPAASVSTTA